ncbi:hypothetical protein [Gemmata sp.]|uniref:hypothetical protein n=1 Tax=Gemmata sp. TaxID=1914242 RepID=UPI003F6E9EA0
MTDPDRTDPDPARPRQTAQPARANNPTDAAEASADGAGGDNTARPQPARGMRTGETEISPRNDPND